MTQCTNVPMISAHDWYKHPMYQSWAEMIGTLVHWYIGTLVHLVYQSWAEMIGTFVHLYIGTLYIGTLVHWNIGTLEHRFFIGSCYVPIMGRNDWDVGALVRLGLCPNHGPK